jgi:hypothetical protein
VDERRVYRVILEPEEGGGFTVAVPALPAGSRTGPPRKRPWRTPGTPSGCTWRPSGPEAFRHRRTAPWSRKSLSLLEPQTAPRPGWTDPGAGLGARGVRRGAAVRRPCGADSLSADCRPGPGDPSPGSVRSPVRIRPVQEPDQHQGLLAAVGALLQVAEDIRAHRQAKDGLPGLLGVRAGHGFHLLYGQTPPGAVLERGLQGLCERAARRAAYSPAFAKESELWYDKGDGKAPKSWPLQAGLRLGPAGGAHPRDHPAMGQVSPSAGQACGFPNRSRMGGGSNIHTPFHPPHTTWPFPETRTTASPEEFHEHRPRLPRGSPQH